MCWSLWSLGVEVASRWGWSDFGIIPSRDVRLPEDPDQFTSAPFFGRQALNVDQLCVLMGGLPGASPEDIERQLLGTEPLAGSSRPAPVRRPLPVLAAKGGRVLLTQTGTTRRLHHEQLEWWQRAVLKRPAGSPGIALLTEATDRFVYAVRVHVRGRTINQGLETKLVDLARGAGLEEIMPALTGGLGNVAETKISADLWALSRGELDERAFLARHGFHGTHEGNVVGVPWRVDLSPIRALVATMAKRPDSENPRNRAASVVDQRQCAEATLAAKLSRTQRGTARLLQRLFATHIRNVELSKAAYLMAVDGVRAATAAIGAELVTAGRLDDPSDALFLTVPELVCELVDDVRDLVAFRRARREQYGKLTLPHRFLGMPEPIEERVSVESRGAITGASGSIGVIEGRAVVAQTMEDAALLEPGDVLVCKTTDPSWVGAMVIASGLVVDIGTPASHGAIVARELGVPCVIGTGDGTARIRTGDRIRVDGAAGTVDVLPELEHQP